MEIIDKIKEKKRATQLVIEMVKDFFELDITKKTRERQYILARSFAYKMLRDNSKMTLAEIGKAFNRDHATVLHSLRQLEGYLDYDMALATDYFSLNSLFINSIQSNLLEKYNDEENYYDNPKYIELVKDFRELSRKYIEVKNDYNKLAISSAELSIKHKNISELFYKREKYYKQNGYIIG